MAENLFGQGGFSAGRRTSQEDRVLPDPKPREVSAMSQVGDGTDGAGGIVAAARRNDLLRQHPQRERPEGAS